MEILKVSKSAALYCKYPGQTSSQGCYIDLDCKSATLSASYNEIGNAVPFSVYYGHEQRWGIPCLTMDAVNDLMEEISAKADRVVAGYKSVWNGNNYVARFNEDATAAIDEIHDLCDSVDGDELVVWSVGDWMDSSPRPQASTSDAELDKMVSDSEPDEKNVLVDGSIEDHLNGIRYERRRDFIEDFLSDLEFINTKGESEDPEFINTKGESEDPVYLSMSSPHAVKSHAFNELGDLITTDLDIHPEDLSHQALGCAYATKFFRDKYSVIRDKYSVMDKSEDLEGWLNGTRKASVYEAAMCKATPEPYRSVCKQIAMELYKASVEAKYKHENQAYFENREVRKGILNRIAELQQQVRDLERSLPDKLEPEHFSMGMDSDACRYKNLAGSYMQMCSL